MKLAPHILIDRRYRLIRKLGSGGFSEVWLAEKKQLHSLNVALKVYYPESTTSEERERFIRKFEMVFNLRHTNLLSYYDCNEDNGMLYFVMPWCERGSVAAQAGKMGETEAWRFLSDVASGLAYLHQKNIIHQDIKPDNVLLSGDNTYLITDFDISVKAKNTRRMGDELPAGTAGYMAPERFGAMSDPIQASDVWGLGASLFELLTGRLPFGENGGLYQKSGIPVPTVKDRQISQSLQNILFLCLQEKPWDRPTAGEICEWCREFSVKGTISLPPKYRKILGNGFTGGKSTDDGTGNGWIVVVTTFVGLAVMIAVIIIASFSDTDRMDKEKAAPQATEQVSEDNRRQEENNRKIADWLAKADAAFNRENRDYNEVLRCYLEAKKLGSTDTTGYFAFLNTAKALIEGNEGEYDEFICELLQKAQQLNNTEEVRKMLNNCK